jgi:hypothetical protein
VAVVILLAVLAAGIWACVRPQKAAVVTGNLTVREVAEIKRVVWKDVRRRVLPSFSWASIKALPANAKWYFKQELRSIDASRSGHIYVTISGPGDPEIFERDRYEVVSGTNGWKAYRRHDTYDFF